MPRGRFSYHSALRCPYNSPLHHSSLPHHSHCTFLHSPAATRFHIMSTFFPLHLLFPPPPGRLRCIEKSENRFICTTRCVLGHRKVRLGSVSHFSMHQFLLHITTGMDFLLCPTSTSGCVTQKVSSKWRHLSGVCGLSS